MKLPEVKPEDLVDPISLDDELETDCANMGYAVLAELSPAFRHCVKIFVRSTPAEQLVKMLTFPRLPGGLRAEIAAVLKKEGGNAIK